MKKILEIKNLCKRYHDENNETLAIDDISFDVYENELDEKVPYSDLIYK